MPNPLTQARKLGFPLVGTDGFLTGLAKAHFGVSPMDQIKMALDAKKQFDDIATRDLEKRKGEQGLQKGALDLETGRYNLGRAGIEDTQKDTLYNQGQTQRAARGAQLAKGFQDTAVGPPNPDGSPILNISPDDAIGMAQGQQDQFALRNADPTEVLSPELAELLGGSFADQAGQRVDRSQLGQAGTILNQRNAAAARVAAAREAAANRNAATSERLAERRYDKERQNWQTAIGAIQTDPLIRGDAEVLQAASRVRSAMDTAKRDPGAIPLVAEAVTVAFAKLQDPNSVVREGEVARLMGQYGLAQRIPLFLNRQLNGGVLDATELQRAANMIEDLAAQSHDRISQRVQPLIDIADDPNNQFDKRYLRDPRAGFQPRRPGQPAQDFTFQRDRR